MHFCPEACQPQPAFPAASAPGRPSFLRSFLFLFSLYSFFILPSLPSFDSSFSFRVSHFPLLPLGVGVIFLLCLTSSLLHSPERRSVPGVDGEALKAEFWTFL
jgi:hypothetical protein